MTKEEMVAIVEDWFNDNNHAIGNDLAKQVGHLITPENEQYAELAMRVSQIILTKWTPLLLIELLEAHQCCAHKPE